MQLCFKDRVVEVCHLCSDTCQPGFHHSAIPISGACAVCENEPSYQSQVMIQVFIYLFSVEVDAIVCGKHKPCFEYQKHRQQNKAPSHGKI